METDLPADIARYAPNTTARLVAGTYSMAAPENYPLASRQVTENKLLFRPVNASAASPDELWRVGSLNPAALAPGNQAVLLLVETPDAANLWEEFVRHRRKESEGGLSVVAAWVPDGAAGRYVVEHDDFFLRSWYGFGPQVRKEKRLLWAAIAAMVVGVVIAATVAQCLFCFIGPFGGFLLQRWLRNQVQGGGIMGRSAARDAAQRWAARLMESGAFKTEYARAFGAAGGPILGDTGEDSFL